jgi:hypothetical protein
MAKQARKLGRWIRTMTIGAAKRHRCRIDQADGGVKMD